MPVQESGPPALPDYLTDPDAVLKDTEVEWRYGKAPDYSKTRSVFSETKQKSHEAGSLPELVQNLVKNWEVEASFKPVIDDWRTIDRKNYSFAINGFEPEGAEAMLKVGTYNAIIAPNEYYSPDYSDFASSHKTFKRMMLTFAWEVLEVYSGPPTVSFRWRHWGVMKNDYVGINNKGEKVTAKAHGGSIDIQGITVATVNDKVQLQSVRTWFDPMDMFRQIAPNGVVKKETVDSNMAPADIINSTSSGNATPVTTTITTTSVTEALEALGLDNAAVAGCPFAANAKQNGEIKLPEDHPPVEEKTEQVVVESRNDNDTIKTELDPEQHGKFDREVADHPYMPGGFR
ncbi:hypothetical protein SLS59_005748 [Nothophoma quercina]|uniref:Pathogen-related protein n=1 Tax=Nothophoma quercina TaxID=749835 RepID=A0ABR3RAB6_9PLEO